MSKKIYVVGSARSYANWMKGTLVDTIDQADLVVFTGGEDVHPSLYKEPVGPRTITNIDRDIYEKRVFDKAVQLNKHIIGICRGSQFCCAASGGRLIQHQDNPQYIHDIFTHKNKKIQITSTHHQAQFPYNLREDEYKVLGWTEGISKIHLDGRDKEIAEVPFKEVEICYYPKTKVLAIQGHPESIYGLDKYKETFDYLDELLEDHMNDNL
jgi:GMP synthase-like glutamine amidotransferase